MKLDEIDFLLAKCNLLRKNNEQQIETEMN